MDKTLEKAHESREVDTGAAGRGVWLVKVPKYLSETWTKSSGNGEVGKLHITKPKLPGGRPNVVFSLDDTLFDMTKGTQPVPKEHKFVLTSVAGQSLSILSQAPTPDALPGPDGEPIYDQLAIDGKVIQRAECQPIADKNYLALKKTKMDLSNKPKREIIRLNKVVQNYKPVAAHSFNLQAEARRKEEGKRARLDKDKVMDMLFNAFEKHQYYNVKDLVSITKQPITYLKEILKEICMYNTKAPHRNMWELKPEYRHYKEPAASTAAATTSSKS